MKKTSYKEINLALIGPPKGENSQDIGRKAKTFTFQLVFSRDRFNTLLFVD
jgi:hypothetical protein